MRYLASALACGLLLAACLSATPALAQDDFTIVALPDTQYYSQYDRTIFEAQTAWVVANVGTLNIKGVVHLGDIVNKGTDLTQWANADRAMDKLDNVVPYFVAIGNHDYDSLTKRRPFKFNANFGPTRFSSYPWYLGSFPTGSNENSYGLIQYSDTNAFLVLVLEFLPKPESLNWAAGIVAANPDKEVLLVTHSFLNNDSTRVDICDSAGVYDVVGSRGEDLWNNFVAKHPNIFLVLNGHTKTTGRRADLNESGKLVNQLLSDFQKSSLDLAGYLRILKFRPSLDVIEVTTFSPTRGTYLTDTANQFTIPWHKRATTATTGTIAGITRVGKVGSTKDCTAVASVSVASPSKTVLSGTNGKYSLTSQTPGAKTITAAKASWEAQALTTRVDAGYSSQLEFFIAPQRGTITGRVTNNAGAAVANATVSAVGGFLPYSVKAVTDANGVYQTGLVAIGTYTVSTTVSGVTASTSTTVQTGTAATADLTLP